MKALQTKGAKFRADTAIVIIRRVAIGILPYCKSETGCKFGNECYFRHVEADEKPSKKSKKSGVKGSVALLMESIPLGSVSQDSHPRMSILGKKENWDQVTPSNSPRTRGTNQNSGEKGSIARNDPKV